MRGWAKAIGPVHVTTVECVRQVLRQTPALLFGEILPVGWLRSSAAAWAGVLYAALEPAAASSSISGEDVSSAGSQYTGPFFILIFA